MRSVTFVENGPAFIMAAFTVVAAVLFSRQMKGFSSYVFFLIACLVSINIHMLAWHIHEGPYTIPGIGWVDTQLLGSYLILFLHIHPFLVLAHLSARHPRVQVFVTLLLSCLYNECVWAIHIRGTSLESNKVDAHLIWIWNASILDMLRVCLQTVLVLVTASSIVRNRTGVYLYGGVGAMQLILAVTLHIQVSGNGYHLTLYVHMISVCIEIVCFYMLLSRVSYHLHEIHHCIKCRDCMETACLDCLECVGCSSTVSISSWRGHVYEYVGLVNQLE
jgi:hypothetical protein